MIEIWRIIAEVSVSSASQIATNSAEPRSGIKRSVITTIIVCPPIPFGNQDSHILHEKEGNLYKFGYGRLCLTELARQTRPPSTALPGRVSSSVNFFGDHTFNADAFYFHIRNLLNGLFCSILQVGMTLLFTSFERSHIIYKSNRVDNSQMKKTNPPLMMDLPRFIFLLNWNA